MPTATTKPPTVPPSIERLLLLPLIALPILWLAGYFFPPINHDVAAILDVSARWVNGERLYVEVIDENLPLTFVVHALPVLTSKILPGDPSFWFTAWVVAGIFAQLNEIRVGATKPALGFLNQLIYQNPQCFNDINDGSMNNCNKGTQGFATITGWDPATGHGSPNYACLAGVVAALA